MLPLMYTDLSEWFHLITRPEDYAEEADLFHQAIEAALSDARNVLELGSGGGNNASFLKNFYSMTLVDLSERMLALSQRINPELPHFAGDMRTVRLNRQFDVVFIHDAVMYMTTEEDLLQALSTAFVHTRPGGIVLVVPDCVKETYKPATDHGGHDSEDVAADNHSGRSLRYLEWSYDPDPSDSLYHSDFVYLLMEKNQQVRSVFDRHVFGVFGKETWLRLLRLAGFEPEMHIEPHSEVPDGIVYFVGVRPS